MPLTYLTLFVAFGLEMIGSYISVLGVRDTFHDPIILVLAVALDVSKIIIVSILYQYWDKLRVAKFYLIPATVVLMVFTSYGAAGYLSSAFQKAMLPNEQLRVELTAKENEYKRITDRVTQINEITSSVEVKTTRMILARMEESKRNQKEINSLQAKLDALDPQIIELRGKLNERSAHTGQIQLISDALGVSVETAIMIVIGVIIFVFDPLAIALVVVGNMMLRRGFHASSPPDDPVDQPDNQPVHFASPITSPAEPPPTWVITTTVPIESNDGNPQAPVVESESHAIDRKLNHTDNPSVGNNQPTTQHHLVYTDIWPGGKLR